MLCIEVEGDAGGAFAKGEDSPKGRRIGTGRFFVVMPEIWIWLALAIETSTRMLCNPHVPRRGEGKRERQGAFAYSSRLCSSRALW